MFFYVYRYILQIAGRDYDSSSEKINRSLPLTEDNSSQRSSMGRNRSLPVIGNTKIGYHGHSAAHTDQRFYSADQTEGSFSGLQFTSKFQNSTLPPHSAQDNDRQIRHIKFRQRPPNQVVANTPSRRSLTPSSFQLNSTPDTKSINDSKVPPPRPSSAIDFGQTDKRDPWTEHVFQQLGLPPRSDMRSLNKHGIGLSPRLGYGRKEDLHHSLQKLLEEREMMEYQTNGENYMEENPEIVDSSLAVGSSANVVSKQMNQHTNISPMNSTQNEHSRTSDYGVYGDEDDDDDDAVNSSDNRMNSGSSFNHNLTSSTASTGFHPSHEKNESCSKEQLAISLAHSLSGGSTNFSSNTSVQHSDMDTSSSQNYQVETVSNGKVHVVNMHPVQNGLQPSERNEYEPSKLMPKKTLSSGSGSISALNSVMSDLRKYADSVIEKRSPPPYQPNLEGQQLTHSAQDELNGEEVDFEKSEMKPIFRKQLSEKVSSRSSRLTQPHNRALSTKKLSSAREVEMKNLIIDRNSNLSPSRLPRPLDSPGSPDNPPSFNQAQKMGNSTENSSKASRSVINQRDFSKERNTSVANSKDSKIPQRRLKALKTPVETISKSSEDLSKMRKKSALKHSIKHFFGKRRYVK